MEDAQLQPAESLDPHVTFCLERFLVRYHHMGVGYEKIAGWFINLYIIEHPFLVGGLEHVFVYFSNFFHILGIIETTDWLSYFSEG